MTEFQAQLRARARESLATLTAAEASGDDYCVEVQRADLENIARIAREHGVEVPELDGFELSVA